MSELARVAYEAFSVGKVPAYPAWRLVGDDDRKDWQRCADAVARNLSAADPDLDTDATSCRPEIYQRARDLYLDAVAINMEYLAKIGSNHATLYGCIPTQSTLHSRILEIARFMVGEDVEP